MLRTTEQVSDLIGGGASLILAGEEPLLRELPCGNWIGGTIPYFMTSAGGQTTRDRIYVQTVPELAARVTCAQYDGKSISRITKDCPDQGYSILILPGFSALHQQFALEAPSYDQLFSKVIGGWVAGVHLTDLDRVTPKVLFGPTGAVLHGDAVAMHVELPSSHRAQLGMGNIFAQGDGDEITFPENGFVVSDCMVRGKRRNFQEYLLEQCFNPRLPLVGEFYGRKINVSIRTIEPATRTVKLFAPVFQGVSYKFAAPLEDYVAEFRRSVPANIGPAVFTCNCVLNYVHGELEGRRTGDLVGPMTFGEIAHQLVNQTLVYITVDDRRRV